MIKYSRVCVRWLLGTTLLIDAVVIAAPVSAQGGHTNHKVAHKAAAGSHKAAPKIVQPSKQQMMDMLEQVERGHVDTSPMVRSKNPAHNPVTRSPSAPNSNSNSNSNYNSFGPPGSAPSYGASQPRNYYPAHRGMSSRRGQLMQMLQHRMAGGGQAQLLQMLLRGGGAGAGMGAMGAGMSGMGAGMGAGTAMGAGSSTGGRPGVAQLLQMLQGQMPGGMGGQQAAAETPNSLGQLGQFAQLGQMGGQPNPINQSNDFRPGAFRALPPGVEPMRGTMPTSIKPGQLLRPHTASAGNSSSASTPQNTMQDLERQFEEQYGR